MDSVSDTPLRLRPVRADDEATFVAAHRAMRADDFDFGVGYHDGRPFDEYLAELEVFRIGIGLPPGRVPSVLLLADVAGTVVGRTSVRFALNEFLAHEGGHIGYGILAEHRRRGHATEILRQSLVVARSGGVGRVLITCDDTNAGSAAVIERCGGIFESEVEPMFGGRPKRRYWID